MNNTIRWRTNSIYSHVELQFSDGEFFSAQIKEGTRFKSFNPADDEWDSVAIPGIDENKVREFCKEHQGRKYDFRGIVDFFANQSHGDDGDWFCSEICVVALQSAGFCCDLVPHFTSPGSLFDTATGYACGYAIAQHTCPKY